MKPNALELFGFCESFLDLATMPWIADEAIQQEMTGPGSLVAATETPVCRSGCDNLNHLGKPDAGA